MVLRLQYTNRDQVDIEENAKEKIRERFPAWSDFLDSDVGWAIVRTVIGVIDHGNFYVDRQAAETFLATAELRESVVAQAKALGYPIRGIVPSSLTVTFTASPPHPVDILIPRGTVLTIAGHVFTVNADATLPATTKSANVTAQQGKLFETTISSSGAAWQQIQLPANIADVLVTVGGTKWNRVDSFIGDVIVQGYRLYEDRAGWTILFGGGIHGLIPPAGAEIFIEGIVTDGDAGNIEEVGLPVVINSNLMDATGVPVNHVTAMTASPAVDGTSQESINSIKDNAPRVYATQGRAVTEADYEAIARAVSGVEGVRAWGGERVNQYGRVFVAVHGANPNQVPASLLLAVREALQNKNVSPITFIVRAPTLITLDLTTVSYVSTLAELTATRADIVNQQREYVNGLGIGGIFVTAVLQTRVGEASRVDYTNISAKISYVGAVVAGIVTLPIIQYVDETSIRIYRASDDVLLWSYGDSQLSILDGQFSVATMEPDGTAVRLEAASLYPDVYPQRDQLFRIGAQNLTTSLAGTP